MGGEDEIRVLIQDRVGCLDAYLRPVGGEGLAVLGLGDCDTVARCCLGVVVLEGTLDTVPESQFRVQRCRAVNGAGEKISLSSAWAAGRSKTLKNNKLERTRVARTRRAVFVIPILFI